MAFGSARQLAVLWSDARDGATELYGDVDVLLDRPRGRTIATYVRRLDLADFTSPSRRSKLLLLDLVSQAGALVERREEANSIDFLKERVLPRFDGSLGGSPQDDLVVNATAQADLTRLATGLIASLEDGPDRPGTRAYSGDDGEPDPPGGGEGQEPTPQPKPSSGGSPTQKPAVSHIEISNVTSTQAKVTWKVSAPGLTVYDSWVAWGSSRTPDHWTYDDTSPYSVTLTPLTAGTTYWLRVYADCETGGRAYSGYHSFFTGVQITSLQATNVSSDRGTIEWTTNLPSTSSVAWGRNESGLANTSTGSNGTFHQVNLTGLDMQETYYYRVSSAALEDSSLGNVSGTFSFVTEMRIENLTHSESLVAGYFNVTFAWDTNFNGTSQVRYGENTTLLSRTNGTEGYHHTVVVSGLKSRTSYYWQAYSEAWNGTFYSVAADVTLGTDLSTCPSGCRLYTPPPDAKSQSVLGSEPIAAWSLSIVNVTVSRGSTWFHVYWNTTYKGNESLTWWAPGGTPTTLPSSPSTASTLTHDVNVTNPPGGLTTGTTYFFALNSTSTSNAGDVASTPARAVTTRGIGISGTTSWALITNATVNWTASANGSSVVRYGIHSIWEHTATAQNATEHHVLLTGLLADTTYTYRVESSAASNRNDTAVDVERTFNTLVGPNDANTSLDAGPAFASALFVEPGAWTGWMNPGAPYSDSYDFFRFQAFAGQKITARMVPDGSHNLDLYLWKPSGAEARRSTNPNNGAAEVVTYTVGSSEGGWWRVEVRYVPGSGRADYTLAFNATGGGTERLIVDVGASGGQDADHTAQTPGISIGSNWTEGNVSSATSKAVDAYLRNPFPDYRETSANGTFYLNLFRTSWERYNDYLFTVQYYSTQDSNVSVWNGAGWVTLAAVPARSAWRAFSFELDHTLFYDAEPGWQGLNVLLRFEKSIQVDLLAAVPVRHTTYVGNGSDDTLDEYHVPGVRLLDGWVNDGMGYKNATASGGVVAVTIPDLLAGYLVRMRFDGNSSGLAVQRWTGSAWTFAASASDFAGGEALFVLDPAWYVDAFPSWPGTNVKLRLVPLVGGRLNETTQFTLSPVHWTTDVGVAGDNDPSLHLPGLNVYPNSEWGSPGTIYGRVARHGNNSADLHLNLPWPGGSMIAYVTYHAQNAGTVELDTGTSWETVGQIAGGTGWRTAILFVQGDPVEYNGPGHEGETTWRTFHDDYGDAFVNADLRFSVLGGVDLDFMWVDIDEDGDNLTSYGEPNPYAFEDTGSHTVVPGGQPFNVDWEALTEGAWQFDVSALIQGDKDQQIHWAGILVTLDGKTVWAEAHGYHPMVQPPYAVSVREMLCTGLHRLQFVGTEEYGATVERVAFRKLPTDPTNPDTDGDGLRDGREACQKGTDPTSADTDDDGLNDFEETYAFHYDNSTSVVANVTTNVTVDAIGEYHWRVRTSATASSGPVQAVVYLDGQMKWNRTSSTSWQNVWAEFDAILPKGLHSLQVQRATANGSVTLNWVNASKANRTNALYADSDWDGLTDGDELLGRTGWMTSPTKADTDGDGAPDGAEVRVLHTDPLLPDTDHDGFKDGVDLDPLHDLVVQVHIGKFIAHDGTCGGDCPSARYQAVATVGPNWTKSKEAPIETYATVDHYLSVNVRDDATVTVKVQVFRTAIAGQNDWTELDVNSTAGVKAWSTTVDPRAKDRYGLYTIGNDANFRGEVWFDIRTVRVGKANTLLVTPNDWSTLNNGTVDGVTTGLHRFVGEQRFVFALLNVTDGDGDLVSYDFETKVSYGDYDDASGNGLWGCHQDESPASGYFGLGARLSGSGSYPYVCGTNTATKLSWINSTFTVAFWIKPEADYYQGSGWRWSFGRQDLWRLGSYAGGVRFEVTDTDGGVHAAQATYPLYAGRWYHLAAAMDTAEGLTRLLLYVNGELAASTPWQTAYAAMDGTTGLYLGYDAATDTRFRGVVDEFRLYKEALSQDAIKGLMWFLQGSNSLVVPRGVFFGSQLFSRMNGSWGAFNTTDQPLANATIYGNDNTLGSSLNGRVIQMVISKNLTLADAWRMLDLALANSTGNVTAFPFFATSEFYTLGLSWEVSKLVANTSVVNGGNVTVAPPPTMWQLFWNTIAGIGEWLWNGLVAVGQFFYNLGKWLVDIGIGLYYGLVENNWTYFKENVVEPFVEALEAFLSFVIEFVVSAFKALLSPLIALWDRWSSELLRAATILFTRKSCSLVECNWQLALDTLLDVLLAPYFFFVLLALFVTLRVIGAIVSIMTAGVAGIVAKLGQSIVGIALGALMGIAVGGGAALAGAVLDYLFGVIPGTSDLWREQRAMGLVAFASSGIQLLYRRASEWRGGAAADSTGVQLALAGLFLGIIGYGFKDNPFVGFLFACLGAVLSAYAVFVTLKKGFKLATLDSAIPNPLEFVPSSIGVISLAMSLVNLGAATDRLVR